MRVAQLLGACVVTALASWSSGTFGYDFSLDNKAEDDDVDASSRLTTLNEQNHIYAGSAADISKYPFIASLSDSLTGSTFCAGTLIAPQFILTAGHCITIGLLPIIATFESNLSSVGEARIGKQEGTDYNVVAGFRHPLYNKTAHLYDIGLLKLEKPVKRPTATLCAADGSDNTVGMMATVFGWGKTPDNNATMSARLNQLTIPIISNAECGKFKRYVGRVTEGMLCAGTGDGRDTCNGDSGGPLLVNDDTIVGFVSWGSRCGEQAGIFTRLTFVMDYIECILAGGRGKKYGEVEPGSEMAQMIADTAGSKGVDAQAAAQMIAGAAASKGANAQAAAGAAGSGGADAQDAAQAAGADESDSGSVDLEALLDDLYDEAKKDPELVEFSEATGLPMPGSTGSATVDQKDNSAEWSMWEFLQEYEKMNAEIKAAESVKGAGKAMRSPSKPAVYDDEASASTEEDTPEQMDVVEQSDLQGGGAV